MTIARRRAAALDVIAAPVPTAPPAVPVSGVPVPLGDVPAPEIATPFGRLRRCTFRRMDAVEPLPGRPDVSGYEVMCLLSDAGEPLPLGDIGAARDACEGCTASGIFRPDED